MSKEIEWSKLYGVGVVVCTCDWCGQNELFDFDNSNPDYKAIQNELKREGWMSCKVNGKWHDFCCEDCRNTFIAKAVK